MIVSFWFMLVLAPIILGAANPSPSELQQQIESVKRERETLLEEQKKLQAELEGVNRESQSLGTAVKALDATRKKLATDIKITQSKINSTKLNILSLENTMVDKERQIGTHQRAIGLALQAVSEYDSRPLILAVLASSKLSDLWRDRSQLEGLSLRLNEEVNALRETKSVLNQEKKKKERVKEQIVSLQGQLNGQKSVVEENQKAKERLLVETKNKEAEYQKLLTENIANQRQFEEDLFRLESELRITLDPSLIPSARNGLLSWPLDRVYITRRFGDTAFDGKPHNGMDFRAAQGTPVKTILAGTVAGTGNTDDQKGCYSYGRWILIKHGNGLSSIYAHLSASVVRTGQTVKIGDIIGYSGGALRTNGSGYSSGPHLHLGLFASQGVQIRQFTTSINCKLVWVPIADVKAYLDPLSYLPSL